MAFVYDTSKYSVQMYISQFKICRDLSSNELVGQIPHTWFTVPYTASGSTNYTSLADTPRL